MKRCPFTQARFIKTALYPKDYPRLLDASMKPLPEIATAGRSNVGKSSLLNHLFRSKNLVKTSSTPGKTQAFNFFTVDDILSFADLPGYGFANVPDAVRKNWGPMTESYMRERRELKLILFLLDIRRLPNEDDKRFIEWATFYHKAIILVLTKTDKVKLSECLSNTKRILDELGLENIHYIHYSVVKNKGRNQLIGMIHNALEEEEAWDN